jgi:monoamine oxidase
MTMTSPHGGAATHDLIVVGAGLSGLVAARRLARAGHRVAVVEARDRVGGRTLSTTLEGQRVDLGGQWIGDRHVRLRALAAELGIDSFPQFAGGKKVLVVGGRRRSYSGFLPRIGLLGLVELGLVIGRLERLARRVDPAAPLATPRAGELDRQSVADWLARRVRTREARDLLGLATQMIFAAEPRELSMLFFLLYARSGEGLARLAQVERGAQERRFITGAQAICERLAQQLGSSAQILLEHPVRAIEQSSDGVVVRTARGELRAQRAILALPPALLAEIETAPALPSARTQLHASMAMGSVIKCIASYATPFWRHAGYSGEAVSTSGLVRATFDDCSPAGDHAALVAFVVGDAARELSRRPEAERRARILDELAALHGPAAREPTSYLDKDWVADPWSRGCYVGLLGPGALSATAAALRAPCDRLHFAGTETAIHHIGYLEGAIEAGERAAAEVTPLVRPATI